MHFPELLAKDNTDASEEEIPMQQPGNHFSNPDRIAEMLRTLGPDMMRTVTPITGSLKNRTDQLGTGTFFRAGDLFFLVTAAHVLRKVAACNYLLRVLDCEEPGHGVAIRKWKSYVGEDPADVAILLLDDDNVAKLPHRRFVHLNEVALRAAYPGGCWVMGFPEETAAHSAARTTMCFNPFLLGSPILAQESSLADHDQEYQFLLDAERTKLSWPDGTHAEIPKKLHGISGCPVWQAIWPDGSWHPDNVRIVGVQTSYYPKRSVIKATHWGAVLKLLHDYHPELRPIIEMHLGPW